MKNILRLSLICLLALGLVACQAASEGDADTPVIRIGSKNFTEGILVSEIYALALEDQGFDVERKMRISGSVIHTSIMNDEIDLYPEYTGTGLLVILKEPMEKDPDVVYDKVKEGYAREFDLIWLDYAQVNNSQGLVMRKDTADALGIRTISDLQVKADQVRFASQGTFDMREDGLVGLEKEYGPFQFGSTEVYSNDLKYRILQEDQADLTAAYTTDGPLVDKDMFVVLEDDRQFWPPYHLAPVVQKSVLDAHPDIEAILNKVSAQLDTDKMIELNARVDVDGEDYELVAKDFYESLSL